MRQQCCKSTHDQLVEQDVRAASHNSDSANVSLRNPSLQWARRGVLADLVDDLQVAGRLTFV